MQIRKFTMQSADEAGLIRQVDGNTSLVLLFGDPDPARMSPLIHSVVSRFPRATVLGCSSAGEIVGDEIHDGTLSGALVGFDRTPLSSASVSVDAVEDSYAVGRELAQALATPDLRGVIVLSDGLNVNGSELVRGINSVFGPEVVVTGGLAADGDRFESTWVVRDGAPVTGVVTAVGVHGDSIQVGHGSRGGWDIFGPMRTVNRSEGNVLYELNGQPALALYKEYLGELASGLPASALRFPLGIRDEHAPGKFVVRTVLGVDEATQSLTFAGDVPQGSHAQLMHANFDRLIESAAGAGELAQPSVGSASEVLSVAISCVGRRLILGERTEEELEAALEHLPPGTEQVGFYSYGEISPFATGHCDLHNQTLTLTTLSERAA